ncbi:MAG: peptidylprolyl isomerase [Candidatus Schekmanbacteria bacterium]|nr:peptidylprolyl isomerase [Candidatus Schekmanbacteria bacterium]
MNSSTFLRPRPRRARGAGVSALGLAALLLMPSCGPADDAKLPGSAAQGRAGVREDAGGAPQGRGFRVGTLELSITLPGTENVTGPPAAEVAGVTTYDGALDDRYADIPEFAKHRYEEDKGRRRMLDDIIQEQLVLRAAVDDGMHRDPEVVQQLSGYLSRLLAQVYFERRTEEIAGLGPGSIERYIAGHPTEVAKKQAELDSQHGNQHVLTGALAHSKSSSADQLRSWIERRILVGDDQVQRYYDEHPEEFRLAESITARHIQLATEADAAAVRARLLAGEGALAERFSESARKQSTDRATGAKGGFLGVIPQGGMIPFLGTEPEILSMLFATSDGQLTPVAQSRRGWHVFLVESHHDAGRQALAAVAERIRDQLFFRRQEEIKAEVFAELRARYGARRLLYNDVPGVPTDAQ